MRKIRVVALMEASSVTGPAKNLIRFGRLVGSPEACSQNVELSIGTFVRARRGGSPPENNEFIEAARYAGIEVDVIQERFRFDPGAIPQLKRLLASRSPDILQTHNIKSHFLTRLCGLNRRRRWIAFHHGYTAEDGKMRAYNQLNRWSLLSADRVVTVCSPFATALAQTGVRRECIAVLPNSIDGPPAAEDTENLELRRGLNLQPGERVILSIGRLSQEKAQADLIAAADLLVKQDAGLRFRVVLVGDGPERERLERMVQDMGLAARVSFVGQRARVGPYLSVADVFVLPSHSEGSPNVILEAMAAGVPIVATAVGGVPETLEHEASALLVAPGRPDALAAGIGRILQDQKLASRLAARATLDVQARFSPQAYVESLVRTYQEVCAVEPATRR